MLSPNIYEEFLKHCRPYPASGPWRDLVIDAECFACPTLGTAALARLSEEFFESELISAGVARRAEDDGLIINSALVGEPNGVIALRAAASAPPYALLTAAGTLSREASLTRPHA